VRARAGCDAHAHADDARCCARRWRMQQADERIAASMHRNAATD
jgi:hypothetical protein